MQLIFSKSSRSRQSQIRLPQVPSLTPVEGLIFEAKIQRWVFPEWFRNMFREHLGNTACSLFPVPCSLFPQGFPPSNFFLSSGCLRGVSLRSTLTCSLFPVPCSHKTPLREHVFRVPCSLSPYGKTHRCKNRAILSGELFSGEEFLPRTAFSGKKCRSILSNQVIS